MKGKQIRKWLRPNRAVRVTQVRARQSGQASIMMGMMILTFVIFFAFVVNTGTLVNAKINLQNAADLAAYAGAATQARQMDQISFLNYEMREQYKKFLFRYYVLGNIASGSVPSAVGSGPSKVPWVAKGGINGPLHYDVPSVCIAFDPTDNACNVGYLKSIDLRGIAGTEAIGAELILQSQKIEKIREENCGALSDLNQLVLQLWLFNTDPELAHLTQTVAAQGTPQGNQLAKDFAFAKSVSQGIGLVPKEYILQNRVKTLLGYINQSASTGLTLGQVGSLKSSSDPAANERSIQAFLSAYFTLGTNIFDSSTFRMDELLPTTIMSEKYVTTDFDVYATIFDVSQAFFNNKSTDGSCNSYAMPLSVRGLPVGVYKDQTREVYYAIRLSGEAKVLLNPFGPLQMTAYAAARPFGSRIGPNLLPDQLTVPQALPANVHWSYNAGRYPPESKLPNLVEGADGSDWLSGSTLNGMYKFMQVTSQNFDITQMNRGIAAARSPTAVEVGQYNIMEDSDVSGNLNDPMVRYFDGNRIASFWAPISTGNQSNLIGQIQTDIQQMLANGAHAIGGATASTTPQTTQAAAALLASELVTYIQSLGPGQAGGEPIGNGSVREAFNIAHLQDPLFMIDPTTGGTTLVSVPEIKTVTDPLAIKTSFSLTNDRTISDLGRVGYSVKFVSFDSLKGQPGAFVDAQSKLDVFSIQH